MHCECRKLLGALYNTGSTSSLGTVLCYAMLPAPVSGVAVPSLSPGEGHILLLRQVQVLSAVVLYSDAAVQHSSWLGFLMYCWLAADRELPPCWTYWLQLLAAGCLMRSLSAATSSSRSAPCGIHPGLPAVTRSAGHTNDPQ